MGIFAEGMGWWRLLSAPHVLIKPRADSGAKLLGRITEEMMKVDGYTRGAEESWTRYGSNAAGDYDWLQLREAMNALPDKSRRIMTAFLNAHPDECRSAGTMGRVAIDQMSGSRPYLLENVAAFYDEIDVPELREDYWYYPLDIIRGVRAPVRKMDLEKKRETLSVALFTLVAAVSIGGLRFYAHYQPDGALELRDKQVRDFIAEQSFGLDQMRSFVADHSGGDVEVHASTIEAYFTKDLPAALRKGHI